MVNIQNVKKYFKLSGGKYDLHSNKFSKDKQLKQILYRVQTHFEYTDIDTKHPQFSLGICDVTTKINIYSIRFC